MNKTRVGIVIVGIAVMICLLWVALYVIDSMHGNPAPESAKKLAIEAARSYVQGEPIITKSARSDNCAIVMIAAGEPRIDQDGSKHYPSGTSVRLESSDGKNWEVISIGGVDTDSLGPGPCP